MGTPVTATSHPHAGSVFGPRRTTGTRLGSEGFSLLEITIVVGLLLLASTIALVMVKNVVRSVHLRETASNYANLLQQARVRAVQDDKYYSVIASSSPTVCGTYAAVNACAFVDLNPASGGKYVSGDPMLEFPADVKPVSSGLVPAVSNLEAQFLPSGTTGTINTTAPGPTFGPRGIPCAPTPSGGYTTCPAMIATSYMTFVKNIRSQNYMAITVTPAGRIRLWSYSNSNWSPMN
jgi:type II secretory pathway pseudopilin PulG